MSLLSLPATFSTPCTTFLLSTACIPPQNSSKFCSYFLPSFLAPFPFHTRTMLNKHIQKIKKTSFMTLHHEHAKPEPEPDQIKKYARRCHMQSILSLAVHKPSTGMIQQVWGHLPIPYWHRCEQRVTVDFFQARLGEFTFLGQLLFNLSTLLSNTFKYIVWLEAVLSHFELLYWLWIC